MAARVLAETIDDCHKETGASVKWALLSDGQERPRVMRIRDTIALHLFGEKVAH